MGYYCGGVPKSECNVIFCDLNNEPDLQERPTNLDPTCGISDDLTSGYYKQIIRRIFNLVKEISSQPVMENTRLILVRFLSGSSKDQAIQQY